ncbi:MAG: tryptophan 7-halogenase [Chloroflexi bacterium]|nr:tryptophan 7-halogenase [Chloroflexota bacterium]MCI0575002.1 tryptophan 7-halogenase [Chloroflexota bacterium]MCI0645770.1 tryptophan 7-halogenase [Chloroflexota bacterium]MCI0727697.1 tryptophan 7-halogenase [Chloroflexota bacterium]
MNTDVVIVGGGPGGATAAMFLKHEGIQSIIVEKEEFPRYHIGESMSGEAGGVLRRLGLEAEMLSRRHPVKRGLTVYGPSGKTSWFVPVMARDNNWELYPQSTWQVHRQDFDKMMLDEAVARGATLLPGRATRPLVGDDGAVRGVEVRLADGSMVEVAADVVLDCSGQNTFLANAGVTGPKYLGSYDKQIAIFSQVVGAIRDEGPKYGDTLIFYQQKYHWSWFIPLDDETVSVGVVIPSAYFLDKKESKRDFLLRELQEINPECQRRLAEIELVEDVRVIPNYSYQVQGFTGKGFMCLGDAHRFIDPIFSFGLYLSMWEGERAAQVIKGYLNGANRDAANPFTEHELFLEKGIDVLEDMIDTFWEYPLAFALFMHQRYRELMLDIFAGRLHERQPSEALLEMRRLLKRERGYDKPGEYSVPIGSRYRPERAPIWVATDVEYD